MDIGIDNNDIKSGFIYKECGGRWKKSWRELWFSLNKRTGVLSYGKYRNTMTSDNIESISINQFETTLMIQNEEMQDSPTPFCFTISSSNNTFLKLAAKTNVDFKSWVDSLSLRIARANDDGGHSDIPMSSIMKTHSSRGLDGKPRFHQSSMMHAVRTFLQMKHVIIKIIDRSQDNRLLIL